MIKNDDEEIKFTNLRDKIVPEKVVSEEEKWMLETPKDIRAESIRDLVTAHKSGFSNKENGNIKHFNIRYKSKKRLKTECIKISSDACKVKDKKLFIYVSYKLGSLRIHRVRDINLFQGL